MDKKILLDWLTFSVGIEEFFDLQQGEQKPEQMQFEDMYVLEEALLFLGIDVDSGANFTPRNGMHGYLRQLSCGAGNSANGGIRILWGGMDTICFDLTGQGCRIYETLAPKMEWLDLIHSVRRFRRHNFSRMDIACDTFGDLQMRHILRYSLEHRYISRWKSAPLVTQGRAEIVDFGSMKSRTMLRIYNKTLERRANVDKDVEVPDGWVRCELQFRDDAVDSFIREWNSCGDVSTVYFGIMANQLRFVKEKREDESHLDRLHTVAWWRKFLDNATPIRLLYKGGLAYNLDALNRYVFEQAGSSLHTWMVLSDWDVNGLLNAVTCRKMNGRQEALVKAMSINNDGKKAT